MTMSPEFRNKSRRNTVVFRPSISIESPEPRYTLLKKDTEEDSDSTDFEKEDEKLRQMEEEIEDIF